jgi:hypothetical protein
MNKYGYVYLTINLLDGKVYVGKRRGNFKPRYFGSGTYLKRALKKYGRDNFIVKPIEYSNNKIDLCTLEIRYIAEYKNCLGKDGMYNITPGGDGGIGIKSHKLNCTCKVCKSTKGLLTGKNSSRWGKHNSDYQKKAVSKALTGCCRSEETKELNRIAHRGKKQSSETIAKRMATKAANHISTKVTVICKWCQKEFKVSPNKIHNNRGIYCSLKCKYNGVTKIKIRLRCKTCGKEFKVFPSVIRYNKGKYCSNKCRFTGYKRS